MNSTAWVAPGVLAMLLLSPVDGIAQSWRTVQRSAGTGSAEWLNVDVRYASGDFTLAPGGAGALYQLTLRYDEDAYIPAIAFDRPGSSLGFSFARRTERSSWDTSDPGSLELLVAEAIPLRLHLELGASRANIDLGGLAIDALEVRVGAAEAEIDFSTPLAQSPEIAHFQAGAADLRLLGLGNMATPRLEVEAGVGRTVLDFSGELLSDLAVDLTMGLGEIELRVPAGVGIDLEKAGLLLGLDAPGLVRTGERWRSDGFGEARRKITVSLAGAIGRVRVVRTGTAPAG